MNSRLDAYVAHQTRSHAHSGRSYHEWASDPVVYRGGRGRRGVFNPPPEIPKALHNRAKLAPIVKTVKIC